MGRRSPADLSLTSLKTAPDIRQACRHDPEWLVQHILEAQFAGDREDAKEELFQA